MLYVINFYVTGFAKTVPDQLKISVMYTVTQHPATFSNDQYV